MKGWSKSRLERAAARAKRSALGRTASRLCGDDAGGVMMEYVVIAVLVAAAVVVGVMFFGGTIRQQFATMSHTAAGQSADAATSALAAQQNADNGETASKVHAKQISDVGEDSGT